MNEDSHLSGGNLHSLMHGFGPKVSNLKEILADEVKQDLLENVMDFRKKEILSEESTDLEATKIVNDELEIEIKEDSNSDQASHNPTRIMTGESPRMTTEVITDSSTIDPIAALLSNVEIIINNPYLY